MHNTVTGKRLERILSLQLDALEKNPSLAKTLPPLMVWGAPGLGKVETFDDSNPLAPDHEWETTGGGGTDFRPVFDYVENHPELDPNLLVFLTDGYGDCPERPSRYPVMWLLTRDGKEQPWGWNVKFSASHGA